MKNTPSNIFNKIFTLKGLEQIYSEDIRSDTATGIDRMNKAVFSKIKEEHFKVIKRKVHNEEYKFTYYKEKLIIKNRNSLPRVISIPTIRDRIVLKGLHILLKETFNIQQPLVQIIINELKQHINQYDAYIKIDLKNFFGTLDHNVLDQTLKKRIRSNKILNLIKKAIQNPTVPIKFNKNGKFDLNLEGSPQGLSISNTLAEIYLKRFDESMNNNQLFNCVCYRYVDDILILCKKEEIQKIKDFAYDMLENNLNLTLNTTKSTNGIITEGIEYLGYKTYRDIKNNSWKFTVRDTARHKFESSLIAEFAKFHYGNQSAKEFIFYLNNKITGVISNKLDNGREKKYGWLFFYSQIDDMTLLFKMDNLVDKMMNQYTVPRKMGKIEIKSFRKAYYEITQNRSKSKYIFKPDELNSEQRKKLLKEVFGVPQNILLDDEKTERIFYNKVYKPIKELEKDTQDFS